MVKSGTCQFKSGISQVKSGICQVKSGTCQEHVRSSQKHIRSEEAQLYELKSLVPERVKVDVEKFSTTAQFWEFMDIEFGDKKELVCDCLAYLRDCKHPKEARSDAQKFQGVGKFWVRKLPVYTANVIPGYDMPNQEQISSVRNHLFLIRQESK